MDFMREERDRGITIQSACITLEWTKMNGPPSDAPAARGSKKATAAAAAASIEGAEPAYRINLIDTPGHVDFTQQVEQSLRVLDGAVCVLDGVKGVEAQTVCVWNQAAQYGVARIAFVNKLDRDGASFEKVVTSIRDKLSTTPLVLTIPVYEDQTGGAPRLVGIVDLLRLEAWIWGGETATPSAGQADTGSNFTVSPVSAGHSMWAQAAAAREALVEAVAEADEMVLEAYLAAEDGEKKAGAAHIPAEMLAQALRRITTALPSKPSPSPSGASTGTSGLSAPVSAQAHTLVVCGSSKANKGVQFLLNAIVDYLPSPLDKKFIELETFAAPVPAAAAATGAKGGAKAPAGKKAVAGSSASSSGATTPASAPTLVKLVGGDPGKEALVALAFKVSHDLQRGAMPIVFVRVYTGAIRKGDSLVSVSPPESAAQILSSNKALSAATAAPVAAATTASPLASLPRERPQKLLEISADNLSTELGAIEAGNIGALVGLKHTRTGDTILSATAASAAASTHAGASSKGGVDTRPGYLRGITFSEPVFFCSVEAASLSAQNQLEQALACLQREDPSLLVALDSETGQTLIKGMGELHLEIVRSRLMHDFQLGAASDGGEAGVEFGRMRISYREGMASEQLLQGFRYTAGSLVSGPALAASEAEATITIRVEPLDVGAGVEVEVDGAGSVLGSAPHAPASVTLRAALEAGVRDGLARGPLLGYPLTDVRVRVSEVVLAPAASTASLAQSLRGCAARALSGLLRGALADDSRAAHLLEPVMSADVQMNSGSLGDVLSDLTAKRRAQILDVGQLGSNSGGGGQARSYIHAEVPLSSMIGYATALRSTTQGSGSFSMQFIQFRQMPNNLQQALIESPP
jgi:elongation factor G